MLTKIDADEEFDLFYRWLSMLRRHNNMREVIHLIGFSHAIPCWMQYDFDIMPKQIQHPLDRYRGRP